MSLQQETATSSTTRDLSSDALIQEVVDSFGNASPERFRIIMQSLVRHLHAFAQEVQFTEDEWLVGIQFLTRVGQTCTDTRQERTGDDHAGPQASVLPADQARNQEEEREDQEQDRPPGKHVVADADLVEDLHELNKGFIDSPPVSAYEESRW